MTSAAKQKQEVSGKNNQVAGRDIYNYNEVYFVVKQPTQNLMFRSDVVRFNVPVQPPKSEPPHQIVEDQRVMLNILAWQIVRLEKATRGRALTTGEVWSEVHLEIGRPDSRRIQVSDYPSAERIMREWIANISIVKDDERSLCSE